MKLETIRKSKKKNILIGGLIALVLVSVVTYTTTRAKYRSVQSVRLANGSVNFKGADMSLVAINVSEDGTNYSSSSTIPEGNYRLNTTKSKCRIPTATLTGENAPEDPNVSIEYTNNKINILGLTTKNTKCYVYLDKVIEPALDTLAKLEITNIKEGTPTFTSTAEGDGTKTGDNSGIYRTSDPMYATEDNPNPVSYYWRGAVTNNYVTFAGKCWRIVRINGDGSIRLIYDGKTCHANGTNAESIIATSQTYSKGGIKDNSAYVGYTFVKNSQRTQSLDANATSNLKKQIDDWFNNNANFTAAQREQIAEGKFCNDRRTKNDETWRATGELQYYAAYARIAEGYKEPSLSCYNNTETGESDIYKLKAGAITADEVQFAGASYTSSNQKYYLYNGQYYWTMSPFLWNGSADVFVVRMNGSVNITDVIETWLGVRPVINLKPETLFNEEGNGTINNPYIVQENS